MKQQENGNQKPDNKKGERNLILELLVDLFVILSGIFLLNIGEVEVVLKLGIFLISGGIISFAVLIFLNLSRINHDLNSDKNIFHNG